MEPYNALPQFVREVCDIIGALDPVRIPGTDIWVTTATIQPWAASDILDKHHIENNRNPSPATYRRYARRMQHKKWRLTPHGLAFNREGQLFDGQNRLRACSLQDEPFTTIVMFNFREDAVLNVDSGKKRKSKDHLRIAGIDLTGQTIAAMNRIVRGTAPNTFEGEENIEMYTAVVDALHFLNIHFPSAATSGIVVEPVMAAVGRASYTVSHDRLCEFCKCLRDRVVPNEDADGAALALIRYLDKSREQKISRTEAWRNECYLKTSRAIRAFASYQNLKSLSTAQQFEYPLPEHVAERLTANMPFKAPRAYAKR